MNEHTDWAVRRAAAGDIENISAFLQPFVAAKYILPLTEDWHVR